MSEGYYIYISSNPISGGGGGSGTGSGNAKASSASKKDEKSGLTVSKYMLTRIAESAAHTLEHEISNEIQAVGYEKGDYVEMKKEQLANSIVQRLTNTGITAGAAIITGHPMAAAITVGVGIVNTAQSLYYDNKQAEAENRQANYESSQLSKRAGFSSSKSGSRGTED